MNGDVRKQIIENMLHRLSNKLEEYKDCIEKDKIFEVKKKLRMEIKELEESITQLKIQDADSQVPH